MPRTPTDELNQTGRVLLGMIAEGHGTGYAIKAEIDRSTRLFWGASIGGIYPELGRLTAAGLVAMRDDPRGESRRHCYTITDKGRRALSAWLNDPSEPMVEMRNEALLRLRFAGVLPPEQRLALVERMRTYHEHRIVHLEAQLEAGRFDDAFDRLTTEYALGFNQWARDWCASAEREVLAAI